MVEFPVENGNENVHRLDTGLWLVPKFPRAGWRFSRITDLGEEAIPCQMCLNASVRYAHVLSNDAVPSPIIVGLKCAEPLLNDYFRPEKREREYRTDLRIRNDWSKREWKTSRTGNPYINARGYNITIWRKGPGFGVTIQLENKFDREFVRNDPKMYATLEEAKFGALDRLLEARTESRRQT